MENREAIKVLEWIKNTHPEHITCEALDLAISALEFRENYDKFWEEVKSAGMKGEETEIHHGGRVFRIREVAQ